MITMGPNAQVIGIVWTMSLIFTISMLSTFATAQQTPGFISIDCGSSTRYKDSAPELTWETDARYIPTGMNGAVPYPPNSSTDNYRALHTFRYFPEWRNKHCYTLPVRSNISVLIRAMFLHGNSSKLNLPIKFDVSVNATVWSSVQYGVGVSSVHSPKVLEGIFYSPGPVIYFCLVPKEGVPFISSLEVRQLDSEGVMYSINDRETLFLSTLCRYNLGTSNDLRTVRYPDDAYDRLWYSPSEPTGPIWGDFAISSNDVYANTSSVWNNVPPAVMKTAEVINRTNTAMGSTLPLDITSSTAYLHAVFYGEAVKDTSGYSDMSIQVNEDQKEPFNVSDVPVLKFFDHFPTTTNNVAVSTLSRSKSILNAFEIYEEIVVNRFTTVDIEVKLLAVIKEMFNLTEWQGDPCFPVPYDRVECSFDTALNEGHLDSLSLSKINNSAKLQNMAKLLGQRLWEQNFPLYLTKLSLTYSEVDDATFNFLVTNLTLVGDMLDFSHNRITTIEAANLWGRARYGYLPISIDMSHNLLTDVPTIGNITAQSARLQFLNLSYNSITSFGTFWGSSTTGLLNLTILDLSHNLMSSYTSSTSMTEILKGIPSLRELNISDNFFTGTFPSELYFSKMIFPNLALLNLDRNNLTGVLNLSTWLQHLQLSLNTSNPSLADGLYSFVDNNIVDVVLDEDAFESTVKSLLNTYPRFNQSGILLSGNPFCEIAKSFAKQYLCRPSVNTNIFNDHRKEDTINFWLILGIVFILLCFIMFTFTIWRLWRKLSSASKLLKEVQQELTNRKVQPPFYPYHDLKIATKNFSEDNKLGSGAFGAVYKGVLPDGTIIAIKRLLNSEKEAVLNDFLNEVVLITGIKHRNLLQLKGCCIKDKERILVYEFAINGNLAEALWGQNRSQDLGWGDRINIAVGVARGLAYLHEELQPRIIHRDIKAANVLLDDRLAPKIGDFGLARLFRDEETQAQFTVVAGTRGYCAPEYVVAGQLTTKADVYSCGILLLEIATGKKCIDLTKPTDCIYLKNWAEDLKKEGSLSELVPPDLRAVYPERQFTRMVDIALLCTRVDPKLRPHMSQVVTMLLENMEVSINRSTNESCEEDIDLTSRDQEDSVWSLSSEERPFMSGSSISGTQHTE